MGSVGSKKWGKKAGLVEKNNKVSPKSLSQILAMLNKNGFMKIYSILNRKKKKGKKIS